MNYNYYNVKKPDNKPINKGAVARIVIWSVVLVILTGLLVCAFVFGDDGFIFGINLGSYVYEDADSYNVGNGELTDIITALEVDWIDGSVSIVPTNGDKIIIIEDYKDGEEELRVRWKVEEGKLTIKYCRSGFSKLVKAGLGKTLTIEVPKAMMEAMGEVNIEAVSADLLLTGMTAYETNISMVSGDVIMNGSFGDLEIDTVSGDVKLEGSAKHVEVDGTSATVELFLTEAPVTIEADTVSGNVSLLLPKETTGFEVTMDAVNGNVSVHGFDDLTQTKGYCRFGDGSVKINVNAVSGHLKIDKKTN